MADAPTDTPETDRVPRPGALEAAGRGGADATHPRGFCCAGQIRSRPSLHPLPQGRLRGAVAGIVNTGAGAIPGILAGAVAGIAAVLIFRAIGPGRPRHKSQAESAGNGRTSAEAAGNRVPEEMLLRAAMELVRRLPAPAVLVDGAPRGRSSQPTRGRAVAPGGRATASAGFDPSTRNCWRQSSDPSRTVSSGR